MITIPEDIILRRLQQTGLLLNFMTEEQKLEVYKKYVENAKSGQAEEAINTQITNLQTSLKSLKAIAEEVVK